MNRVRAFTLLELMQVMIIVSILMTILGGTFYYFSSYHNQLTNRVSDDSEISMAQFALINDAAKYRTFTYNGGLLQLGTIQDSLVYMFGNSLVRKTIIRKDTFSVLSTAVLNEDLLTVNLQKEGISIRFVLENQKGANIEIGEEE